MHWLHVVLTQVGMQDLNKRGIDVEGAAQILIGRSRPVMDADDFRDYVQEQLQDLIQTVIMFAPCKTCKGPSCRIAQSAARQGLRQSEGCAVEAVRLLWLQPDCCDCLIHSPPPRRR